MKTCVFLLLIFSLLSSFSFGQQCGKEAGGGICPSGQCCSKNGLCGSTEDYCKEPNCQSQCLQCGSQVGGTLCPNGLCCSKWGFCGSTDDYCKNGCQSQCSPDNPPPPSPVDDLSDIFPESIFDDIFPKVGRPNPCRDRDFFTYEAFITAAKSFPEFGTTGDITTRKQEIAAFFGQTSYETKGSWLPGLSTGEEYASGYCHKEDTEDKYVHCVWSDAWPCTANKRYYGRGPMMMTWNYNYGPCGDAIGADLFNNPELVAEDAVVAFKTALWFWMTPKFSLPSCHAVISGKWVPSDSDLSFGRLPGYGATTNILNGLDECYPGYDDHGVANRIGFYKWCCDKLGVDPGENIDCSNQFPFVPSPWVNVDSAI